MLNSKKQLKEMVLYSYAHIDRLQDERSPYYDPPFPKKVKVGTNRIGFVLAKVERYVQVKIEQRDSSASRSRGGRACSASPIPLP